MNDNKETSQYASRLANKKDFVAATPYQQPQAAVKQTKANKTTTRKCTVHLDVEAYNTIMSEIVPQLFKDNYNGAGQRVTLNDYLKHVVYQDIKRRKNKKDKEIPNENI